MNAPADEITVAITATGANSVCGTEHPMAVDAVVSIGGLEVGEVTLIPDHEVNGGELDIWGDLDHWASQDLIDDLDRCDDRELAIREIVGAVRKAVTE
jgi:hypothetical protein